MAFVSVNMLEHLKYGTPGIRNNVNHAHFCSASAFDEVVCHCKGMFLLFFGLFFHPVCKSVPTFFSKCESHLEVKV